jgi:hypothetical protein
MVPEHSVGASAEIAKELRQPCGIVVINDRTGIYSVRDVMPHRQNFI